MNALIALLVVVAVAGLIVWAVNRFIPMDERFRQIFNVIAVVGILIYVVITLLGMGGISIR